LSAGALLAGLSVRGHPPPRLVGPARLLRAGLGLFAGWRAAGGAACLVAGGEHAAGSLPCPVPAGPGAVLGPGLEDAVAGRPGLRLADLELSRPDPARVEPAGVPAVVGAAVVLAAEVLFAPPGQRLIQGKPATIARPVVSRNEIKRLYELCPMRTLMVSTRGNNLPARIPKT